MNCKFLNKQLCAWVNFVYVIHRRYLTFLDGFGATRKFGLLTLRNQHLIYMAFLALDSVNSWSAPVAVSIFIFFFWFLNLFAKRGFISVLCALHQEKSFRFKTMKVRTKTKRKTNAKKKIKNN